MARIEILIYRTPGGQFAAASPTALQRLEVWEMTPKHSWYRKPRRPIPPGGGDVIPEKPKLDTYLVILSTQGDSPDKPSKTGKRKKIRKISQWEVRVEAESAEAAIKIARGFVYQQIEGTPLQRLFDWADGKHRLKAGAMKSPGETGRIIFRKMQTDRRKPYTEIVNPRKRRQEEA